MHFETAIVMIVGIVALVSLRLILIFVGKEYAADHPRVSIPRRDAQDTSVPTRVVRGTGRSSHLLYFPDPLPKPATRIEDVTPAAAPRVVPLARGKAS